MVRPIRDKNPDLYRLITIRTVDARFFLKPNKQTNKVIGGIIARYASILEIEILAYNFLSNHYHLLIKAPKENADEFEENVNREIAKRVNFLIRREGTFWGRRYDDQPILNEEDLLEAFLYVTTNAVKHGLVKDPSLWPGVSSYNQSITDTYKTYHFIRYSEQDESKKVIEYQLRLSPLPQFKDLKKKARISKIKELVNERVQRITEERKANGQGFLDPKFILMQNPYAAPREISRATRPYCYSKNPDTINDYREHVLRRRDEYIVASAKYRLGESNIVFPEFCFKPPLHRKPRSEPFKTLPDDYFKNAS